MTVHQREIDVDVTRVLIWQLITALVCSTRLGDGGMAGLHCGYV